MTSSAGEAPAATAARALAIFHDRGAPAWGRVLAPGFRHCFAAIAAGPCWITADARGGRLHVNAVARAGFDLAGFYRRHGFTVVPLPDAAAADAAGAGRRPPLLAATCVGATKWLLGIDAPWVFTPLQLHRHLVRPGAGG